MTAPLLELQALSCERDERKLFARLDLQCHPGDLVQLLGPNGSGKTTLLRALTGLGSYEGQLLWRGQPIEQVRHDYHQSLLYLGHHPGIKKGLTARENLVWYTTLSGDRGDIKQALASVGLRAYVDTPCQQMSAGQLRRVALARLFLSQAPLWILDEPFTAIDQRGVAELEVLFARHAEQGGVVLLTSHQDLALPGLRRVDLGDYRLGAGEVAA